MDVPEQQDAAFFTRPLPREQCYLCVMTLVDPPPSQPPQELLRVEHKKFLAGLESRGLIFGAGKLANEAQGESSDLGYGMFILRAESRADAEKIAREEPFTKHGYRTMKLYPWQRTEGDITLKLNFTNGTLEIDRRRYKITPG